MKSQVARIILLLVISFPSARGGVALGEGTIKGFVVDQKGLPVPSAKVNADQLDGRPRGSVIRYVETDSEGHFVIDRLGWGKYKVFARKEDAGYPDTQWSFYSNDTFPIAEISPKTPIAELRIQLGPRAAALTGSVANAETGAPLAAEFRLTRSTHPEDWLSTSISPSYKVLLPPSTDILLEVSAPGFETWTPGHTLHLESGAEMHLDIFLQPSHDSNLHPSKFLVPEGYVGWLLLEYNVKGAEPVSSEAGVNVFKFPSNGRLSTSSSGPERGAEDEYFYYSDDGSTRAIPGDYLNGKGMIWGQHEGTTNGVLAQFGFFVGSEQQYKKFQIRMTHPGPISPSEP
jgi:hypothetical protein